MAKPAIVFIGFMGAGKSTALAAAREAGLETTEIDELMEAELGKPIRQAFEEDGEEAFRAREAEVVGSLLEKADGGAIALGGGSILSERVRGALDRHIVVLAADRRGEAWRRIAGTDRPLATSEEDVARLLAERALFTRSWPTRSCRWATADVLERALPAIRALAEMPAGTKLLWASSASGEYPVFVGFRRPGERVVATRGAAVLRHRSRRRSICRARRTASRARSDSSGGGSEDDGQAEGVLAISRQPG